MLSGKLNHVGNSQHRDCTEDEVIHRIECNAQHVKKIKKEKLFDLKIKRAQDINHQKATSQPFILPQFNAFKNYKILFSNRQTTSNRVPRSSLKNSSSVNFSPDNYIFPYHASMFLLTNFQHIFQIHQYSVDRIFILKFSKTEKDYFC